MVLLTPSVMCFKDVKCVAHSERGHTISNLCGFTERQIKFQRFFSVFVFRCKTHCNVYGGIRLRDCAYPRRLMCSRLLGVTCCILFRRLLLMASGIVFGFPSALQQCICQVKIAQEVRGVNCMFLFLDVGVIRFRGFYLLLFTM